MPWCFAEYISVDLDAQLTATDIQNSNETKLTAAYLASAHLLRSVLLCCRFHKLEKVIAHHVSTKFIGITTQFRFFKFIIYSLSEFWICFRQQMFI